MVVPQSGQVPLVIGLPFFVRPSAGFTISFFALHFTQYASLAIAISTFLFSGLYPSAFPEQQALLILLLSLPAIIPSVPGRSCTIQAFSDIL
jgi:hypothetical protein